MCNRAAENSTLWTPEIERVNFFVARIAKNLTNELCDEVGEKSVFFRLTIKRLCRLYIRRPGMTIVARNIEDSAAIFSVAMTHCTLLAFERQQELPGKLAHRHSLLMSNRRR